MSAEIDVRNAITIVGRGAVLIGHVRTGAAGAVCATAVRVVAANAAAINVDKSLLMSMLL